MIMGSVAYFPPTRHFPWAGGKKWEKLGFTVQISSLGNVVGRILTSLESSGLLKENSFPPMYPLFVKNAGLSKYRTMYQIK